MSSARWTYCTPSRSSTGRRPLWSTPRVPAASTWRAAASRSIRAWLACSTLAALARPMTQTPSSSATTTSPGLTIWPAQHTVRFTEPGDALTVPCACTARLHTGKPIARRSATSRTPASMTRPAQPRWASEVAISSPTMPSVDRDVVVTTRTSPGATISTAACTIRLSPGGQDTVTAGPAIRVPSWTGRMPGPSSPVRPAASCTVATPAWRSAAITAGSARSISRTTKCAIRRPLLPTAPPQSGSGELAGYGRVHPLVRLALDRRLVPEVSAGVAHQLGTAPGRHVRVVLPEVLLARHHVHSLPLALPDLGDVEQQVRLEVAHFALVRLEAEHRGRAQRRAAGLDARGLGQDA